MNLRKRLTIRILREGRANCLHRVADYWTA
jgi:hypothetical protein